MDILNIIIFFIFGTLFGSFVNVLVLRYNTGHSCLTGRSKCMSCGKKLSWYELVPLFSFVFLEGKCLGCGSKISPQYFIVESLTGILFSALFVKVGLTSFLPFYLLVTTVLIAMSVYDFRHKIIPDGMVFTFDAFALIFLFFSHGFSGVFSEDFLAGPILFLFFWALWFFSKGKWMGFGDAKLALGVGWLLGFSGGTFAIMMAFWMGAAWSIAVMVLHKLKLSHLKLTMKSEIPFAPFIIIALFTQLFTGWTFLSFVGI